MSTDSLAVFRKSLGPELGALAEEHLKHDLRQSDRDALQSAASTIALSTSTGSALGVALGLFLAFRLRRGRQAMFNAFQAQEKPTALKFASGREQPLPDITALVKPSRLGDFATYTLLGFGGLFFGGETGLLTGTFLGRRGIARDSESRDRIQTAWSGWIEEEELY